MAQIQLKMKRHLHNSFRALFLSIAVLLSLPMLAVEVEINGINYELVAKIKEATVIAKSSGEYSGKVVIPESVEHEGTIYSVTSIVEYAFYDCNALTSITIPNTIKKIGSDAFYGCYALARIYITDIASWCGIDFEYYRTRPYSNPLWYCPSLYINEEIVKDLIIPDTVTSIGNYAFYNCKGLNSVTIPNSITSIGEYAFYNCSNIKSVNITDLVSWCKIKFKAGLESNPLYHAKQLYLNGEVIRNLEFPHNIDTIGAYAFAGCNSLTSISIPDGVKHIKEEAFNKCI